MISEINPQRKGIRALIIEDNLADARLLEDMLGSRAEDYSTVHTSRLEEGLRRLECERFDVVLLDLGLPDSVGEETVKSVRGRDANIPILVMSGQDEIAAGQLSVANGAQDFVSKNGLDSAALMLRIKLAVERSSLAIKKKKHLLLDAAEPIRAELSSLVRNIGHDSKTTPMFKSDKHKLAQKLRQLHHSDDVGEIVGVLASASRQLNRMNTDLSVGLEKSQAEIERLSVELEEASDAALSDPLTGLGNRRASAAYNQSALQKSENTGEPFSLLVLDIDYFKAFNDKWGHQAGDHAIKTLAVVLEKGCASSDFLSRFGGEEFMVSMMDTDLCAAAEIANKLRRTMAQTQISLLAEPQKTGNVTISIGVAQFNGQETLDEFFARADRALYKAKQMGRNRVEQG